MEKTWVNDLKTEIRRKRLQALQCRAVKTTAIPPFRRPWQAPSYFHWMERWSEKAKSQISMAIATGVTGGKSIDWNIGLYVWMESAAVYLRDWPSVFDATRAAQEGRREDALRHLADSDAEIQQIATRWDSCMHYVTICDLTEERPDSDPTLDGPFCGVFFSSNPDKPFIGLVFKGTHIESWQEMIVDLHYLPVQAEGHVWNTHVSQGVYATLFGPFASLGGQTPFGYVNEIVRTTIAARVRSRTKANIGLHLTGHSLGASYATLFYAELLRLCHGEDPTSMTKSIMLRDLYTFGSPRLGLDDFADVFSLAIDEHAGYSWRISSDGDPVPWVPPVLITDAKFIHLDVAYLVSSGDDPVRIASERNSHPRPPIPVINMSNHTPWAYFNSMYRAATGSPSGFVYEGLDSIEMQ